MSADRCKMSVKIELILSFYHVANSVFFFSSSSKFFYLLSNDTYFTLISPLYILLG
jgi:hypothetical protein